MKSEHAFIIGVLSSMVASVIIIKAMSGDHKKSMETSTTPKADYNVIQMPISPLATAQQTITANIPKPIKNKPFPENQKGFTGYRNIPM